MTRPMADPDVIWLEPYCTCPGAEWGNDGRQWCQDDVWTPCPVCKAKPTRYIRDRRTGRRGEKTDG